ncbi:MAG: TnpV protein [Eubacteriales bacterium]|nr:TnpV protein [Eubacteriales bacterium]
MKLTYTENGDYLIPDLALSDATQYRIGKYGRMRKRFLQEHRPGTYSNMVLTETLWKHLADIDAACREQLDLLIPAMAKAEDVTEALKASDQMEWARRMNNIRNRAEETVLRDLIYAE